MMGWYPDPGGSPGRYRWFDGEEWSSTTTADPGSRPPRTSGDRRLHASVRSLIMIAAVTAVGLTMIATAVRWVGTRDGTPLLPVATGSPTPYAIGTPCTGGSPETRLDHPRDGRVHGGGLAFPAAARFAAPAPERRLTFAWDVQQQVHTVDLDPAWVAQLTVAQLRPASGFTGPPRVVAERALGCLLATELYRRDLLRAAVITSEARTVGGRAGWAVTAEVAISVPNLDFPGERLVVIIVPFEGTWGLFFSAVPLDDADLLRAADVAANGLQTT